MTGLACNDVVGKLVTEVFNLTDDADGGQPIDLALIFKQVSAATKLPGEPVLTGSNVTAVSVEVTITPLHYSQEKEIDGYVVTLYDVTLDRQSARELTKQAMHDPLTGLINRRGFERRLQEAVDKSVGGAMQNSVCFIDLDHFKVVNDTCGHQAGDELLKQVTSAMHAKVRDSDVFARLGGDEFAVLLNGCAIENAQRIADGLCRTVAEFRFDWEGREFTVGASIGLAPMIDRDTAKSVMEVADGACYRAKEQGRGRVWVDLRA
jgi:diguanylate cyclase (GGDEF)-like protein